jgi:hypothetical protein
VRIRGAARSNRDALLRRNIEHFGKQAYAHQIAFSRIGF